MKKVQIEQNFTTAKIYSKQQNTGSEKEIKQKFLENKLFYQPFKQ